MAEQHTAGPWSILNEDAAYAEHWSARAPLEIAAGTSHLATAYSRDNATTLVTGDQGLANARLIAAAPDLLKLAVNILQAKKDGTWESDQDWFVEHATAAIAKATGSAREV